MKVNLKYAQRQLRFWQKKVEALSKQFEQEEFAFIPSNVKRQTSNAKEGEETERNLPPTPPIRKEKEEQENVPPRVRVGACDAKVVPEEPVEVPMEFLMMAAKQRGIPEDFVKQFHETMVAQGWVVRDTTKEGVINPSRVTRGNVAMIMGQWWLWEKKHPERQGGPQTPSFQKHAWNHLEPKQDEVENAKRIFGS